MPDPTTLGLFALAALALLLIPGPSVLFIVTRSLHQGRRAGLVSALGVQAGGLLHVLAATVGLSALLLSSALLFGLVKFLGAGYLIYLGVRTLLARTEDPQAVAAFAPQPLRQVFWQGALVNALNPKTALFFLAFLPQFIRPAHGPVALQTLVLGLTFLMLAVVSDSTYALLAGSLRRYLSGKVFAKRQKYLTGSMYMALGVGAAVGTHP